MAPKKTSAATVTTSTTTPVSVPVTAPVTSSVQKDVPEDAPVDVSVDRFAAILAKLQSWQADIKEAIATIKVLNKEFNKMKTQKGGRKARKMNTEKRTPSGFAKPTNLSDELCDFLGVARGSSLARTEVTRIINQYVKDNKLQHPDDRRMIVPDAKLKTIVTLGKDDKLTYFNLQSFIKRHFKTNATVV